MPIKWDERSVIKAFQEAMTPPEMAQKPSLAETIEQIKGVRQGEVPEVPETIE